MLIGIPGSLIYYKTKHSYSRKYQIFERMNERYLASTIATTTAKRIITNVRHIQYYCCASRFYECKICVDFDLVPALLSLKKTIFSCSSLHFAQSIFFGFYFSYKSFCFLYNLFQFCFVLLDILISLIEPPISCILC